MSDPVVIDTNMHGYGRITGSFVVRGQKTAVVETGPKNTVDNVVAGLRSAGVETLDWIVVTHVHLDHAGAAGTLAQLFPGSRVAVHPVGAPHLENPAKLWSSATRIYGDRMDALWGGIDPVPGDRIHVLEDGDKIDLGGRSLQAIETPGHAYHHHAFLDDSTGMIFTGDAIGVRLPGLGVVRPTTPPPEFHLVKAIESIRRIQALRATSLCLTHFGPAEGDVDRICEEGIEALEKWAGWVRDARSVTTDLDEVTELVKKDAHEDAEGRLRDDDIAKLEQTTSYWMNTWGYMRYLDKNES